MTQTNTQTDIERREVQPPIYHHIDRVVHDPDTGRDVVSFTPTPEAGRQPRKVTAYLGRRALHGEEVLSFRAGLYKY